MLDGYGADEMASAGRGQVLIPWPNRIQDGALRVRRHASISSRSTSPEHGNAIHGLVRWVRVDGRRARRRSRRDGAHAAPAARLSVLARARHRVLALRGRPARDVRPRPTSARGLPVRERPAPVPDASAPRPSTRSSSARRRAPCCVTRRARPPGANRGPSRAPSSTSGSRGRSAPTKLDNAFTDLERDDDGLARVELRHPDGRSGSRSGSTRATRTWSSSPAIRFRASPSQPRRRADDLPAERVPDRRGRRRARARRVRRRVSGGSRSTRGMT